MEYEYYLAAGSKIKATKDKNCVTRLRAYTALGFTIKIKTGPSEEKLTVNYDTQKKLKDTSP